jgi:O-antigen/teichoic acid export membrane protein
MTALAGPALLTAVATAARDTPEKLRQIRNTALLLLGLLLLPAILVSPLIVGPNTVADMQMTISAALSTVLVAAVIAHNIPRHILATQQDHRALLKVTLLTAGLQLAGATAGVMVLGTNGYLVGTSAATLVAFAFAWRATPVTGPWTSPDWSLLPKALKIGGATMGSGLIAQYVVLNIRQQVTEAGGVDDAGLFQASLSISTNIFALLTSGILNRTLPIMASATSREETEHEIRSAVTLCLQVVTPTIAVIALLRPEALRILFSGKFVGATDLLGLQLATEVARATAYVVTAPLLYRGRWREFLALEALGSVTLFGAANALVPRLGLPGAGLSYLVTYFVYLLAAAAVVRRTTGASLGFRLAFISLAAMGGVASLSFLEASLGVRLTAAVIVGMFSAWAIPPLREVLVVRGASLLRGRKH